MTQDELIETLKPIAWPDPHEGKALSEITEAAPKKTLPDDLVVEAIRQFVECTVEERWTLVRRWVKELPRDVLTTLNNAMTMHPEKKHEFRDAVATLNWRNP